MQADARAWNALARKAFEGRNYRDALDLYLEALKHSEATASPSRQPTTAPATTNQQEQQQQQPKEPGPPASASADPPELAVLCSNVAAVLLKLDRPDEALQYAAAAVEAAPHWPKALYRQACALMACEQYAQAVKLLKQVQQGMDPYTVEARSVGAKLHEAVSVSASHHHHLAVQSAMHAAHLSWVDTRTAEASCHDDLLGQLQQGMAGVSWEPQDWEWRPTWMPSMRNTQQQQGANDGQTGNRILATNSTEPHTTGPKPQHPAKESLLDSLSAAFDSSEQQQQYLQLLAELTLRLAELEGPQRAYKLLRDESLLHWYKQGLAEAVAAKKAAGVDQPVVLVVAHGGGGLLGMLAAAAGAGRVYVVEQGRWGFRAASQLLEGNKGKQQELVDRIELVPVPLERCRVRQQQQQQEQHQHQQPQQGVGVVVVPDAADSCEQDSSNDCSSNAESDGVVRVIEGGSDCDDSWYELQGVADILVTDMFDYSVLGQGLLPMMQQVSSQGLLAQDAILLPSQLVVKGQLVNTHMDAVMSNVSGFNVQGVNKYRWHPTMERIDRDRLRQHQVCSEPFQLMSMDLARHQETKPQTDTTQSSCGDHCVDGTHISSSSIEVPVQAMGSCDACVVWFDLVSNTGLTVSSKHCSTGSSSNSSNDDSSHTSTSEMMTCSTCFGLGLYYLDEPLLLKSTAALAPDAHLPQQQQQQQLPVNISATIAGQQQLNISVNNISNGSNNSRSNVSLGLHNIPRCGVQQYSWSPHGTPRHAYLPRWHFDMLADETRNNAYDDAIRREVKRLQQGSLNEASPASGVHVLDIGTGTGLLAMMAARAGAETVMAVESVRHLAETARDAVALNGLRATVKVIHKDGRYLTVAQESGSGDMQRPADLLVFEVFDCGLIGEGALHIVAAARSALLRAGGKILPAAAKVYCQPIQYQRQLSTVLPDVCDPAPIHCYGWQQDYFEVELAGTLNAGTRPHTGGHPAQAPGPCDGTAEGPDVTSEQTWHALAEPQVAFEFDFNCAAPLEAFQPAANQLAFCVTQSGVCNAVAFWFELQLDDVTTLSNSPYVSQQPGVSGTTWKQAVQLLPEHTVEVSQTLTITASHDTYAINFTNENDRTNHVCQPTAGSRSNSSIEAAVSTVAAPQPTGVPLYDSAWKAACDRLAQLQSQLVKAITQDPLEYRRLVCAAMQLAMRPWGCSGDAAKGQRGLRPAEMDNTEASSGLVWRVADPHHAAAMLVRLMT